VVTGNDRRPLPRAEPISVGDIPVMWRKFLEFLRTM